jgi:hypothetical protein
MKRDTTEFSKRITRICYCNKRTFFMDSFIQKLERNKCQLDILINIT